MLGTCNRSEIYCPGQPTATPARPSWGIPRRLPRRADQRLRGLPVHLYRLAAARHLFLVASGLDSLVLGEASVLGQVKAAYALAGERQTVGAMLNPLFQMAFNAAKRVAADRHRRRPGQCGRGGRGLRRARTGKPGSACVLNVGAGKMNALMLRRLAELGCRRFIVLNRSPDKAAELAGPLGGQAGAGRVGQPAGRGGHRGQLHRAPIR